MLNKQGFNGNLGEKRTEAILSKGFLVSTISVDIEGRDFIVEDMPSSLTEIQESKKRITCKGIIQAKYFENNNEVKIARQYVEDNEEVKTDFFAFIHTDDIYGNDHVYFFTAYEIQKNFVLRTDGNKDYYIFRLSNQKKYLKFKNIPKQKIIQIIKDEISRTEEFRNEDFIRRLTEKWINPENEQNYSNEELFKSLKGKHIVDKMYIALNSYNDFRRVHGWRLGEKVSFHDKINTRTYYHNFALRTNNQQIIDFFSSIKIGYSVTIKNKSFFNGVSDIMEKINSIVIKLNQGNINTLEAAGNKINIAIKQKKECKCPICSYRDLNFSATDKSSHTNETDNWLLLHSAFAYFNLGKYEKSKILLNEAHINALNNKQHILSYICKYNLTILGQYIWEENLPNLYFELQKLSISSEKKEILKFVSEQTLINSYLRQIDDSYLKIKDYQQRSINNSTLDLVNTQRIKIIECIEFYRGNRLFLTEEFDTLFEKHVESCIISFSMQCNHRKHLDKFDDFILESIFLYCDPQKLIKSFQRNNISAVPYVSDEKNYFLKAITNFFSNQNINYLKEETKVLDGKIENYDLRRKIIKIFSNICIVVSYVDVQITKTHIDRIFNFVSELDLSSDECSFLAYPIFQKSSLFNSSDLIILIRIILKKDENQGYLLTNCLYVLQEKKHLVEKRDYDIIKPITDIIMSQPNFHTLRPFSKILMPEELIKLKDLIENTLDTNFDIALYYEAVTSLLLQDYEKFSQRYSDKIIAIINRSNPIIQDNSSTLTGISYYISSKLRELIEIIYTLGKNVINKKTLTIVKKIHPYYNFLIEIENFKQGDPFEISWLNENGSQIILEKLSESNALKPEIKKAVNGGTNKNLLQLYFEYFTT